MKGLLKLVRAEWERSLGVALIAAGVVALIAGYVGVQRTQFLSVQMSYLTSGGIGGLFLLGLGAVLIVAAGLHDEWRKLEQLVNLLQDNATPINAEEIVIDDDGPGPAPAADDTLERVPARSSGRRPGTATLAVGVDVVARRSAQQVAVAAGIGAIGLMAGWMKSKSAVQVDDALAAPFLASMAVAVALALAATRLLALRGTVAASHGSVVRALAPVRASQTPRAATLGHAHPGAEGGLFRGTTQRELHRRDCPTLRNLAAVEEVRTRPSSGAKACRICRPFDET